jgi:hypothetical protein
MKGRCRGMLQTRLLGAPSVAAIALIIGVTVRRSIAALMLAAPAGEDDRKVAENLHRPIVPADVFTDVVAGEKRRRSRPIRKKEFALQLTAAV